MIDATWWAYAQYPAFFILGAIVSLINSIAGGGSTLSLPIMIFLGMPATVANGTNRIGLIIGNCSSAFNLMKHGYLNKKIFLQLLIPTIVGTCIGVCFLVHIGDRAFQAILACVICLVVVMSNLRKDILGKPPATPPEKLTWKGAVGFAMISIYGCIVQVGVGFVQIFALTRYTGLEPIRVNALKNALTNVFLLVSTTALGIAGKINWPIAIVMAAGAWLGGYCGSFLQRKKGNKFIQHFVSATSIAMAIYLVVDLIVE
ncbi:MAG: sulfite exporter TauE/SafE family protein [Fibrobacter sp.]|uniref:sulfite exporter TauE/SafE family protein n=1 Tax=Fibrobacter sp. TaxID=35828 RepID=UPI0025C4E60D|nr:sulfite exporter TauE/SafE family protein [Fibrobacter sp.]MBR4785954.1 sulfite exporter TauE/SafE family protein [Fibrobacter sp.]